MPASISFLAISGESLAGPMVQTIFVLRIWVPPSSLVTAVSLIGWVHGSAAGAGAPSANRPMARNLR